MAADTRRYQVFVSSTYADLREERQAVIQTLLDADAFPAGMELFPATDDDAWTLIEQIIGECDYYLLVVGGRYGSVDDEADLSYTEKEYNLAQQLKKPTIAFLHAAPDELPLKASETDTELRAKLEAFRNRVEAAKHVKYWRTPEDLAGKVATSFNRLVKTHPAVGWIRADRIADSEVLQELAAAQRRIDELEGQLQSARTAPPPGTQDLAQGSDTADVSVLIGGRLLFDGGYSVTHKTAVRLPMTWDALFAAVGPSLMDEADDQILRQRLAVAVRTQHIVTLRDALVNSYDPGEHGDDWPDGVDLGSMTVDMTSRQYETILVQFMALGLIERSDRRNRSVKDKRTYWTLTPFGHEHTVRLRAIRRDGSQVISDDDEDA